MTVVSPIPLCCRAESIDVQLLFRTHMTFSFALGLDGSYHSFFTRVQKNGDVEAHAKLQDSPTTGAADSWYDGKCMHRCCDAGVGRAEGRCVRGCAD